jgi:hypothetical protein
MKVMRRRSGTTLQTNAFNGDGNRVQQTAGSSAYTYSYSGLNLLYEKNATSGTTTVTKRFYAGGVQVVKMVNGVVFYLHEDALGSVRIEATVSVIMVVLPNYAPYESNLRRCEIEEH